MIFCYSPGEDDVCQVTSKLIAINGHLSHCQLHLVQPWTLFLVLESSEGTTKRRVIFLDINNQDEFKIAQGNKSTKQFLTRFSILNFYLHNNVKVRNEKCIPGRGEEKVEEIQLQKRANAHLKIQYFQFDWSLAIFTVPAHYTLFVTRAIRF